MKICYAERAQIRNLNAGGFAQIAKLVQQCVQDLMKPKNYFSVIHNENTKDLKSITKEADILIVAIGEKEFIKESFVKEDAIVIDVGINRDNNKLYGDCDFENIKDKCKAITPVPGGVGPLTITMLMNNVIEAYSLQKKD